MFLLNSRLTHFTATPLHFERLLKMQKSQIRKSQIPNIEPAVAGILELGFWSLELPLPFCALRKMQRGTPSSEVTGLDCRVP